MEKNVYVFMETKSDYDALIKEFYPNENVEKEEAYWIQIENFDRNHFYDFLKKVFDIDENCYISLENDERTLYEFYAYKDGNIIKEVLPESYKNKSGESQLLGILFHMEKEIVK